MSNVIESPTTPSTVVPVRRTYTPGRYLLITGLLLLFGGLIWMVVGFGSRDFKDVDAQRADQRYKIYEDVLNTNQKTLNDPPTILSKEQGRIRLPLADAMALTLRDINANKPHTAYPIQTTEPAPNPAPPADPKAPAGQVPNTANANNPVLPKQADAAGSTAPNGNPNPSPSPAPGMTNPR